MGRRPKITSYQLDHPGSGATDALMGLVGLEVVAVATATNMEIERIGEKRTTAAPTAAITGVVEEDTEDMVAAEAGSAVKEALGVGKEMKAIWGALMVPATGDQTNALEDLEVAAATVTVTDLPAADSAIDTEVEAEAEEDFVTSMVVIATETAQAMVETAEALVAIAGDLAEVEGDGDLVVAEAMDAQPTCAGSLA
mmetsp:Transcript_11682/g.18517  ORF Transcript_11682/g.18517 Transcript_11682/m.18517 type:complete len:197 (+) Transcript_11682:120-710(+)